MTAIPQPAVLDALTEAIIPGRTYVIDPHGVVPQLATNTGVVEYTGRDPYSIHRGGEPRYGWYAGTPDEVNALFAGKVWSNHARSYNYAYRQWDDGTDEPVVMIIAGTVEDAVRVALAGIPSGALRSDAHIAASVQQDTDRLERIVGRGGTVLQVIDGAVQPFVAPRPDCVPGAGLTSQPREVAAVSLTPDAYEADLTSHRNPFVWEVAALGELRAGREVILLFPYPYAQGIANVEGVTLYGGADFEQGLADVRDLQLNGAPQRVTVIAVYSDEEYGTLSSDLRGALEVLSEHGCSTGVRFVRAQC